MDAKLKRTTLRLPQALYDRIEAAATGKLSMNALIIEALEEKFPAPLSPMQEMNAHILSVLNKARLDGFDDPTMADLVNKAAKEWAEANPSKIKEMIHASQPTLTVSAKEDGNPPSIKGGFKDAMAEGRSKKKFSGGFNEALDQPTNVPGQADIPSNDDENLISGQADSTPTRRSKPTGQRAVRFDDD
ncbi:hypothetical protein [Ruegeria jejuensis]|uniref:hypothetical protein n=1 Tax=Ruegeria jejuensis TaxID=3233338 RepID=UPI00355B50EA